MKTPQVRRVRVEIDNLAVRAAHASVCVDSAGSTGGRYRNRPRIPVEWRARAASEAVREARGAGERT